jgi:hypothetical protein
MDDVPRQWPVTVSGRSRAFSSLRCGRHARAQSHGDTREVFIVQPYTDRLDRQTAIIVSAHLTAAAAFAELERVAERLRRFDLPGDVFEMRVVDSRTAAPKVALTHSRGSDSLSLQAEGAWWLEALVC